MNRRQIRTNWHQLKGQIKNRWARLRQEDIDAIDGNLERLKDEIKAQYGITKEEVEKQILELDVSK